MASRIAATARERVGPAAPWRSRLSGTGFPAVTSFDTTGAGASPAATFQVGRTSGLGDFAGGGISQTVALQAGSLTITADVAAFNPGGANGSRGVFELLVDGNVVATVPGGGINNNVTFRSSLPATLPVTAG